MVVVLLSLLCAGIAAAFAVLAVLVKREMVRSVRRWRVRQELHAVEQEVRSACGYEESVRKSGTIHPPAHRACEVDGWETVG